MTTRNSNESGYQYELFGDDLGVPQQDSLQAIVTSRVGLQSEEVSAEAAGVLSGDTNLTVDQIRSKIENLEADLKSLRLSLFQHTHDPEYKKEIEAEIASREAELRRYKSMLANAK